MQEFLTDLGYEVSTQGLEDFIVGLFAWIRQFDPKMIDPDYIAELLTKFSFVWNPIWEKIGELLGGIGF